MYIYGINEVIGIYIYNIDRFFFFMFFVLYFEELEIKRCEKMGIYIKMIVYFNYVGNNYVLLNFDMFFKELIGKILSYTSIFIKCFKVRGLRNWLFVWEVR